MSMTLPLSPASGNSPISDMEAPNTPVSPISQHDNSSQQSNHQANPTSPISPTTQIKRKPSRRANTAERRATHNAVERQRRETLNGRFLDLAALLPNLSQIRRPSKSSIVNSSIAHIHASRRHRLLAARELRMLKHEADALRRELNEWRDRAGIPRIEEPVRGDAFSMVLSGELEVIAAVPGDDENEDGDDYAGYPDEDYPAMNGHSMPHGHQHHQNALPHLEEMDDHRMATMIKPVHAFPHNMPSGGPPNNGLHLAHILPRPSTGGAPMLTSPTSFEAASMYESHHNFGGPTAAGPAFMQQQQQQPMEQDKIAAWYGAQSQQQVLQAQRSIYTPPATSHNLPGNNNGNGNSVSAVGASPVNGNSISNGGKTSNSPTPQSANPFGDQSSQNFFPATMPRHQQGYASDEGSVGSSGSNVKRITVPVPASMNNAAGRGRAMSSNNHGAHGVGVSGSPGCASPVSTGAGSPVYEVDSSTFGRRPGPTPNEWRDEVSQHHGLMGMPMGMSSGMMMSSMAMGMGNGLVGNSLGTMVPVGGPGGGSGGGFAMMM